MYSLAIAQGLTPARARIAAAVGMAESKGDPNAHNTNAATGDNSYGLWQINMLGDLAPERLILFGIKSGNELFDPQTNAKAMRILSANGADFSPWSAYNHGTYKEFLNMPVTDQTNDPLWKDILKGLSPAYAVGSSIGGVTDVTQGIGSVVETVNKTASWLSNSENWVRVGYVVGGGAMIIVGLVMMVQSTTLGSAVTNLVPAGRVANLAKSAKRSGPKVESSYGQPWSNLPVT
jgi:hypothetical protein